MNNHELITFKTQIEEDMNLLVQNWLSIDPCLDRPEYAFNYWVLDKLYSIDEALILDYITEYSDKGIDCYVHYDDEKELYIIQNKYYAIDEHVKSNDVAYFLQNPLSTLKNNRYTRSSELQNLFNDIFNDPEYKIFMHFYTTSSKYNEDIINLIKEFNNINQNLPCIIIAEFFSIEKIYEKYMVRVMSKKSNLNLICKQKTKEQWLLLYLNII